MSIVLIPAINGSNAIDLTGNTYLTIQQALDYFDRRVGSAGWYTFSSDDQSRALITGAQMLDASRNWIGAVVREDQPLAWPRVAIRPNERRTRRLIRTGFETLNGATGGLYDARSRFWSSIVIPTPIKDAQCELAFSLLVAGLNLQGDGTGIKTFTEDGVSVTYDKPQGRYELPPLITRLLAPLSLAGPELQRG